MKRKPEPTPRCIGCGCDAYHACILPNGLPCSWVRMHPPLCTACAQEPLALGAAALPVKPIGRERGTPAAGATRSAGGEL
jgi:hypothetical protein